MRGRDAGRDRRRDDRSGPVDVIGSPPPEPRTVRFLGTLQPRQPAPHPRVAGEALQREHLHGVRGDVRGRRIDHGPEITERQLVGEVSGIVGVERPFNG